MVGRRTRLPTELPDGMRMSDIRWLLLDSSTESCVLIRVRLSLRRSRSVFSPRTAPVRVRLLEACRALGELATGLLETADSCTSLELFALEVVSCKETWLGE